MCMDVYVRVCVELTPLYWIYIVQVSCKSRETFALTLALVWHSLAFTSRQRWSHRCQKWRVKHSSLDQHTPNKLLSITKPIPCFLTHHYITHFSTAKQPHYCLDACSKIVVQLSVSWRRWYNGIIIIQNFVRKIPNLRNWMSTEQVDWIIIHHSVFHICTIRMSLCLGQFTRRDQSKLRKNNAVVSFCNISNATQIFMTLFPQTTNPGSSQPADVRPVQEVCWTTISRQSWAGEKHSQSSCFYQKARSCVFHRSKQDVIQ